MKKDPKIFLSHIFESVEIIEKFIHGVSKEKFLKSLQLQDAVIRRLQVVGEAVKNLPPSLKEEYPQIPWKKIAGTRDIIIHEYFGIDLNLVWRIATEFIPELKENVSNILKDFKK